MLRQPPGEIKVVGSVDLQGVAPEEIRDDGVVPIGGELVGHQLRVLPDANHVWEKDDRGIFVDSLACRLGDVGFDIADFDAFAGWLAAERFVNICPIFDAIDSELEGR